jgi:hypothetical protein
MNSCSRRWRAGASGASAAARQSRGAPARGAPLGSDAVGELRHLLPAQHLPVGTLRARLDLGDDAKQRARRALLGERVTMVLELHVTEAAAGDLMLGPELREKRQGACRRPGGSHY